jgi:hypothetical protein
MNSMRESPPRAGAGWRKAAALVLGVAVVELPVNELSTYALLLVLAVAIFTGEVSARPRAWLGAAAVVAAVIAAQVLLSPPRIEEGHNVFLPGAKGEALRRGLPAEVYQRLAAEFDTRYPPKVRCPASSGSCWQAQGQPERPYAFSADGIWHKSAASRSVTALDFFDPVWLRLGFINELRYNWGSTAPDLQRAHRDRRFWMGLKRWQLDMPWFEMIRLPAAYAGGELCWRGEIMWESAGERFTRLAGDHCRAVAAADAGKRVFGIAIAPGTLAMNLVPPWRVRVLQFAQGALVLAGACGLILLLVRVRPRPAMLAFLLIGLAVLVIAVDDASFLGGVRPFDGGDDGLYYDGVGRILLRHLLAGDVGGFLRGGESVYYYGGPGLRYFRALEHIVFGESYLGYLSLILLLPFVVLGLFRRFLPENWALALALIFVAVPVGALFGTTFAQYVKWAARGFADSAAYIFFFCGLLPILRARGRGEDATWFSAVFGALLLALGICMKPIIAPACAVVLGGAGLAALYHRQWARLAGLCIGFLPVFSMALHNWVFGHVFVLFSSNSGDANLLVMPPSAYVAAVRELAHLDFSGLARVLAQLAHWLSGPAESYATIPLNAAGVAILVYVVVRGRGFDPWLRLIAGAALAQHAVALFYNAATARYHFLAWFLTMLVAMVWLHRIGVGWFAKRYPAMAVRIADHPLRMRLASGLAHLQKSTA